PAVGGHHPMPGHGPAVVRHHGADLARPALAEVFGDRPVGHDLPRRDLLDERQHVLGEVVHNTPPYGNRGPAAQGAASQWAACGKRSPRSEEHTSELQSLTNLVCRLLLEKKKTEKQQNTSRDTRTADGHNTCANSSQ